MKRLAVLLTVVACMMVAPFAQAAQYASDPCLGPKQGVAISETTNETKLLVAQQSGNYIDVCGVYLSTVGGTATFEYGTKVSTACDTGATAITGAIAAGVTISALNSGNASLMQAAKGTGLCLVTGASTTATVGWITYVQTPNIGN